MLIYVPSVWHSGTNVLAHSVLKRVDLVALPEWKVNNFHVTESSRASGLFRMPYGGTILAPLRHPRRIWASWLARGKDDQTHFNLQMHHLMEMAHRVDGWLHVDDPVLRALQVKRIGELTGLTDEWLQYDWKPNKRSGSRQGLHDISLDECPQVPEKFIQFYEDTKRG